MFSIINNTLNQIHSCKEYLTKGRLDLTSSLFGLSISNIMATVFDQKTNIISSKDCLTDSVYRCASITQEIVGEYFLPSVITALDTPDSLDNLVFFADKITYCVLPESDLYKNACWGALLNAHYIAGTILGIGLGGYILYRSGFDSPKEPQPQSIPVLEQIPHQDDEPFQNSFSAPAA
jgi:hypothetical protein